MNMDVIKLTATKGLGRSLLITKKYGPEILTTVGIVGTVTSAVLASKATLKLEGVIDEVQGELNLINYEAMDVDTKEQEREVSKAKGKAYIRGTLEVTKLYGPSVSLGVASIGCIVAAHGIMRKRNVAMVAAYNVLEKGFAKYRARVIDEFGVEKDREFRLGVKQELVKNPETGKDELVYVEDEVNVAAEEETYSRYFGQDNRNWEYVMDYNLVFLRAQLQFANDMLHARGHIFLNEVYDALGIARTRAGSVVGWVDNGDGDGYVDFGSFLVDGYKEGRKNNKILLDFNVDGIIFDKIELPGQWIHKGSK